MRDAVIISTARTPIGKAYRGAFNDTTSPTMASFAMKAAIERAGVEPGEIEDLVMGAALQQGSSGRHYRSSVHGTLVFSYAKIRVYSGC